MPDVQEVFRMATQKVRPDAGAMDRQLKVQRRRYRQQRGLAIAVVAVIAIALVATATALRSTHTAPATPAPTTAAPKPGLMAVSLGTTTAPARIAPNVGVYQADVSPDGTGVAFVRAVAAHDQLFLLDLGTGRERQLTGLEQSRGGTKYCACGAVDPSWSPDGTRIAFSGTNVYSNEDIYVVDVQSGEIQRITSDPAYEETPTWSPDGSQIAFARGRLSGLHLWAADVATGRMHLVTDQTDVEDPAWQPSGEWIAFSGAADVGGGRDIWLVHPDGSDAHALVNDGEFDRSPAWSADGTRLAFAAAHPELSPATTRIVVLDVASGAMQVIGSGLEDPAWGPDGSTIYAVGG